MPNCKPSGHFVQCQHIAVTNIVKKNEYEQFHYEAAAV